MALKCNLRFTELHKLKNYFFKQKIANSAKNAEFCAYCIIIAVAYESNCYTMHSEKMLQTFGICAIIISIDWEVFRIGLKRC